MSNGLTGQQKAAILMIALGPENSARVVRGLSDTEIEQLTMEMSNLGKVSAEARDQVLDEFYNMYLASDYISQGGFDYAREVLEKALGEQRAFDIISRLSASLRIRPFDLLRRTDPKHLLSFIQGEHPQTIALIASHLPADKGAVLLSNLEPDLQVDVARRIALMGRTSPDVIKEVEEVLEQKISSLSLNDYTSNGGISCLVDVLNRTDPGTLKNIMNAFEKADEDLAEQVKRQMFVFQDIIMLDDRSVQLVLREIDAKDIALALKGANPDVVKKIQANMSARAAQMLKEDIEFLGPVRLRDVDNAQVKIINIIRKLEESGTIVIPRGGNDELVY